MKIADTIDWRRVRNINILSMVSGVYEKNGEYQEAKDILLLAFERAPMGKRLLYKLAELAIKEGSPDEAEDYYREFCELAPEDPRQYVLRYLILGAKGAPVEQLIHTLEPVSYTHLSCRGRVIAFLLAGQNENREVIFRGSREDLARHLGISRAALFRELAALQSAGAVEACGNRFYVTNLRRLEEMLYYPSNTK